MLQRLSALALLVALTGCNSGWLGEAEDPPLPGKRIPVLVFDQQLKADPSAAASPLQLPEASGGARWPSAGGNPTHGGGSYALASSIKETWRQDIGSGVSDDRPILAIPVASGDAIYTLDTVGEITALAQANGKQLWQRDLVKSRLRDKAAGGGIALGSDALYASLGYGEVVAISAADGTELWRTPTKSPLRSAPTAAGGKVYVVTIDNQLIALDARSGQQLWTHQGMLEAAGLLGAPSPAVAGDLVLVAYSSGELYALRSQNGGELWAESLASSRKEGGVLSLAAIRGLPVLAAGGVAALAVSNSGRMVAVDTRSGQRVWEQRLSGQQMPWVAGNAVFVVTTQAQLMALNLADGRIRWVQQLEQWEHPKDKMGLISWYGPVLAGGKLWLTSSEGNLSSFDPATGAQVDAHKIDTTNRPPLVVGGTLFTLDDDGRLTAWK